jgi:hypothetical protein
MIVSRRRWLQLAAGFGLGLIGPETSWAIGPKSKVRLAQLRYKGGLFNPRPTGLARLAWEIDKRTSIDIESNAAIVRVADKQLFSHPLLYMGGDRAFDPMAEEEIQRLYRHLIFGGMLMIDSADPKVGGTYDQSVRQLLKALFPKEELKRIGPAHTIYNSFYLLDSVVGRVAAVPYFEGIEHEGRLVVIYGQNDLAGAWARDNFGRWEYGVHPGGERQRELGFRWGINLVMYALCIDYKADQVHVPFILKRRKWQIR